jgi:putative two-component system response regulator
VFVIELVCARDVALIPALPVVGLVAAEQHNRTPARIECEQRANMTADRSATGRHLERMPLLCGHLAHAAGLGRRQARLLRRASALHDLGKIAIPDKVLLKPGKFEPHERKVMCTHAALGAQMLAGSSTSLMQMAEVIALTHHERWDGTGYPAGLAGEDIPLEGRICAICDVFDALISHRRYKASWTLEAALAEIERGSGSHFDPRLTKLFLRIAPRMYGELATQVDLGIATLEPGDDPGNGHAAPDAQEQAHPSHTLAL